MLLQDVLDAPDLGIRLLHGAAALTRPVHRACTTDMPDPTRYVSTGSVVFTGLVWRRAPEDSEVFVAHLVRSGVAAVAAGEALFGEVPADFVDACVRHDLPLLAVPDEVPFSRVIEFMTRQWSGARMDRLQTGLARQRRLLAAFADGHALDDLLARLCREFDVPAWLFTATGTLVAGNGPVDETAVDAICTTALTTPRFPATTGGGHTVLPVGAALRDRTTAWFLALGPGTAGPEECLDAFTELATVAALERVRREDRRRAVWETSDARHLADVVGAAHPSGTPLVAVVVERAPAATPEQRIALRAAVHDALPSCVTGIDAGGRVVAVVPGTGSCIITALGRRLGRLTPALAGGRIAAGVSGTCAGESIDGGIRSAQAAAAIAREDADQVSVRAAELDSAVGLLAAVPDRVRRAFADRTLGQVLDYDRRSRAGLMTTLEAFLDCDGSWRRTADRLHLHPNTVRYRIGRVEALTGRNLAHTGDRLDVFLAVRALT
ncbi:PucR family transcriptional regulator [Rhodococcus phenolicus]|uniref:PucR family transcriptional regulator n=1 Tax=Rhodococcus phenolicus TaxID=263849 RepID=UPI00082D739F|nr:PucR family transcriptional regulator [Rhodococcus phenolicus]